MPTDAELPVVTTSCGQGVRLPPLADRVVLATTAGYSTLYNEFDIHYSESADVATTHDLKAGAEEFRHLDATAQAELIRSGAVSPIQLVDAAIARIKRINPRINALASSDFALARERARTHPGTGPLAGVPTLVKDVNAYPGLPLGLGSRLLQGHVPATGSPYTDAIDASGAIVLGKSTTSEFALLGTTETLACGATRNPWDASLSPGGSSGGAAAAVASGMVPVAHASDAGGSIRGPASFCGVFGFKPSRGLHMPTDQPSDSPLAMLVTDHCVSRSVRDSVAWLASVERRDAGAARTASARATEPLRRRLRIGLYERTGFGDLPDAEVSEALARTRRLCESLGHRVAQTQGPQFDALAVSDAFFVLSGLTVSGACAHMRGALGPAFDEQKLEPFTRELARRGGLLPASAAATAVETLRLASDAANRCMTEFDVLLCPTVGFPAFPLGVHGGTEPFEDAVAFTNAVAGYTAIASIAGWPAMSVPLQVSSTGLPIGSHFAAPHGEDAMLLALALELEQAAPWHDRWPTTPPG
jgi:amidase